MERCKSVIRYYTCVKCGVRAPIICLVGEESGEELQSGCPRCGKTTWLNLPDIGQVTAEELAAEREAERCFEEKLQAAEERIVALSTENLDEEIRRFL